MKILCSPPSLYFSTACRKYPILHLFLQIKNTIRDGVSTALCAAFTVDTGDTVNTVDMVYTVDMVDTVDMVYTVNIVLAVDMVYTVDMGEEGMRGLKGLREINY